MSEKLPELEKLLVSKSRRSTGYLTSLTFVLIGIYILGTAFWRYYSLGDTKNLVPNLILGCAAFFVVRYQKLNYISPIGPVRETHTWLTHHREVLKWDDIQFITIMHKGSETMLYFEKDVTGWKVLFETSQTDELKAIFKKYIPNMEINEMNR